MERPAVDVDGDGSDDTAALGRCLRCGTWVRQNDTAVTVVIGEPAARAALADLPQPVRVAHGRTLALLRLLAVERLLKARSWWPPGSSPITLPPVGPHCCRGWSSCSSRPLGDQLDLHLRGLGLPTSELSSHAIV